jgi:hypothetical protein
MELMKKRMKTELDESKKRFNQQLKELIKNINKKRCKEIELEKENSKVHLYEEKLNEKLVSVKKRYFNHNEKYFVSNLISCNQVRKPSP